MLSKDDAWDIYELICNICKDIEWDRELIDRFSDTTNIENIDDPRERMSELKHRVSMCEEFMLNIKIRIRWLITIRKMVELTIDDKRIKQSMINRINKTNEKVNFRGFFI